MLTHLEVDAELTGSGVLDPELGTALAEGWDSCIPCMATHAIASLSQEERVVLAEWLARLTDEGSQAS
jgi:hypothetical protein